MQPKEWHLGHWPQGEGGPTCSTSRCAEILQKLFMAQSEWDYGMRLQNDVNQICSCLWLRAGSVRAAKVDNVPGAADPPSNAPLAEDTSPKYTKCKAQVALLSKSSWCSRRLRLLVVTEALSASELLFQSAFGHPTSSWRAVQQHPRHNHTGSVLSPHDRRNHLIRSYPVRCSDGTQKENVGLTSSQLLCVQKLF